MFWRLLTRKNAFLTYNNAQYNNYWAAFFATRLFVILLLAFCRSRAQLEFD